MSAMWAAGDVPVVLFEDGFTTRPVDARAGMLGSGLTSKLQNPLRRGGMFTGGTEWRIAGHRTLRVKTAAGGDWEVQCIGRLERAPALVDGVLVVIDEAGTLYSYQADSGTELWRKRARRPALAAPLPEQARRARGHPVGHRARVRPGHGDSRTLAPAGRGLTLALPYGDGALLVGSGAGGLKRFGADGIIEVIGDARPRRRTRGIRPLDGVAWVGTDAVQWMATGAKAPVAVPALGKSVEHAGRRTGRALRAGQRPHAAFRRPRPARPSPSGRPRSGAPARSRPSCSATPCSSSWTGTCVAVER